MNRARSTTVRSVCQAFCYFGLLPACLVLAGRAAAQTAQLLKDINTQLMPNPSSKAGSFVQLGAKTLFVATRSDVGTELWISDGSSKGTTLLKDIRPGSIGSGPSGLLRCSSQVFFTANDGKNGQELWKTDGTRQGTLLVRNIAPGVKSTAFMGMVRLGKIIVFLASDQTTLSLWRSDGTTQGTQKINSAIGFRISGGGMLVAGPNAYFCSGGILWKSDGTRSGTLAILSGVALWRLMPFGNLLLFTASGTTGHSLWLTDGTKAGTKILRNLPATTSPMPNAESINKFLFFTVLVGGQTELWRSDASSAGTIRLKVFNTRVLAFGATVAGSKLFFSVDKEAWVSDGFATGTQRLAVFSDRPDGWTSAGDVVFFTASGAKNGRELWSSDGTPKGTKEILDIWPGPLGSSPRTLRFIGKHLYFSAYAGLTGSEPWRSDGTPGGTILLRDIRTGRSSSAPLDFVPVGSKVIFTADDRKTGREPWITDGTPNGTQLLIDLSPIPGTKSSRPTVLGRLNGSLIFAANDGINGSEVWITDGSTGRTSLLVDINPGPGGSYPMVVAALDNVLFFVANDGVLGWELWMTDGSKQGTRLVKDIAAGQDSSFPLRGTRHGEEIFFPVLTPGKNRSIALWKTDGTGAGTKEFWPGEIGILTSVGDKLFFATDAALYVSDGSTEGTKLLAATPIVLSRPPREMAVMNGEVYFGTRTALWKSDGSKKGTVLLHSIPNVLITSVITVGTSVFFRSTAAPLPSFLYRTNGTRSGLQLVTSKLHPGGNVGTLHNRLLFFAIDTNAITGLWSTDGTGAGTKFLAPIVHGINGLSAVRSGNRNVFFHAIDLQLRRGLWVTDGSPSGTKLVKHGESGLSSPILVNGKVIFTVDDPKFGKELWVLDPGATTQALGLGCTSAGTAPTLQGSDPVLGGNMSLDGNNVRGRTGLLLMSTRAVPSIPLPAGCRIFLAPSNMTMLASFPVTNGKWTLPLFIPNQKSLLGLQVVMQSFHLSSSSALGFDISNALLLSLGN